MIKRFTNLILIALAMLASSSAFAQSVAFTFDDGPHIKETPTLSAKARNQAMLNALAKHKVTAALFVTVNNGANTAEGLAFAKAWGDAGHAIGNHTMSHPDLNSKAISLAQYQQEILVCDKVISTLPGYQKWFRYTFLREGNTPEKRDGMVKFLTEQNYRNAYVSLDTSDWALEDKLTSVLSKDPKADVSAIKRVYLEHIWQRAVAYRELSQKLQGRDIAQVILLHHNLINALWLDDIIAMFKTKGWKINTPAEAFADPVYQLQPALTAAGQSLLLSMSRALGIEKFDGWLRLRDDGDFELAELKKLGL